MTLPLSTEARPRPLATGARPRPCLYRPAHKGLRLALTDIMTRFGALDLDDEAALGEAVAALKALCSLMRQHHAKEEAFIHAPLRVMLPGAALDLDEGHRHDLDVMARLVKQAEALVRLPAAERAAPAHTLYLDVAEWTAEVLVHATKEEREITPRVQDAWDDSMLVARLHGIVAAFETLELDAFLRWMLPALRPQERVMLCRVVAEARGVSDLPHVLALAGRVLEPPAVRALAEALQMPAPEAPTLVVFEFPFAGPFGDAMTAALSGLARDIAQEPGFLWKVWAEDAEAGTAAGVYAFASRALAERYVAKHGPRLEAFGVTGIRTAVYGVNTALSAIDNARFLPAA